MTRKEMLILSSAYIWPSIKKLEQHFEKNDESLKAFYADYKKKFNRKIIYKLKTSPCIYDADLNSHKTYTINLDDMFNHIEEIDFELSVEIKINDNINVKGKFAKIEIITFASIIKKAVMIPYSEVGTFE